MHNSQILTSKSNLVPTGSDLAKNAVKPDRGGVDGNPIKNDCGEQSVSWQSAMRRAIRSPSGLLAAVGLTAEDVGLTAQVEKFSFPMFAPLEFVARMERGNPNDPLLRQVLPSDRELDDVTGFRSDPVGDLDASATKGLLHKYDGRALMIATGACGVHCRYCFRQEYPYSESAAQSDGWRESIHYLRQNTDVEEVILSGGDPLTLVDRSLIDLVALLDSIPHLRRLRIHTRMPIVIPQRITTALLDCLQSSRLATWFVVHSNHANELDDAVLAATDRLIDAGIPVLNQAVLLRGVNNTADALVDLCERLINHRIQPYYLHQLDRVRGSAHFEIPVAEGLQLMSDIRKRLPGYAVPTYVQELPGEPSKTLLT